MAPIALYPDPLLAQTLAASTYPLELIQLQQWLAKNPKLKDKALADAVAKQPWDPAVQSMAAFPDAVKRLADDIQWTTDLGNAFLAQQGDVMEACQRMRKKAKGNGALKTTEQQMVETKVVETKEVIVIEPANPEVIYVPSYSPRSSTARRSTRTRPSTTRLLPGAAFFSFTAGVMIGAAVWGGAWGHCGWGHNDINININNNFNRNEHQPEHQQRQPGRRQQLAAQLPAPGRRPVRRQGHREQVRRPGARRLALEPPGERPAAAGARREREQPRRPAAPASRIARAAASRGASAGTSDRGGGGDRGASASSFDRGGGGERPGREPGRRQQLAWKLGLPRGQLRQLGRLQRQQRTGEQLARVLQLRRRAAAAEAAAAAAEGGGEVKAMKSRTFLALVGGTVGASSSPRRRPWAPSRQSPPRRRTRRRRPRRTPSSRRPRSSTSRRSRRSSGPTGSTSS